MKWVQDLCFQITHKAHLTKIYLTNTHDLIVCLSLSLSYPNYGWVCMRVAVQWHDIGINTHCVYDTLAKWFPQVSTFAVGKQNLMDLNSCSTWTKLLFFFCFFLFWIGFVLQSKVYEPKQVPNKPSLSSRIHACISYNQCCFLYFPSGFMETCLYTIPVAMILQSI